MARLIILGAGSIVPTPSRFASSIYLESRGDRLLIDCGPGTLERLRNIGLNPSLIDGVLLTHYHIDHVSDLLPLIKARAYTDEGRPARPPRQIKLIGPKGLRHLLRLLIEDNPYFSYLREAMRYHEYTEVTELGDGEEARIGAIKIRTAEVKHYGGLAYRVELDGKSIAFSGDTIPDDRLVELARHVDVLVHECSFPSDELLGLHTSEEGLASIVERCRPRVLVVTHLYPVWSGRETRIAEAVSSRHRCRVIVASDYLEVNV